MSSPGLPVTREDLQLLAQVGLLACDGTHAAAARLIFENLRIVRPDHVLPVIGLGCSYMALGEPQNAAAVLSPEMHGLPDPDGEVASFQAQALIECGRRAQAEAVLRRVVSYADPKSDVFRMAARLLGMIVTPGFAPSSAERHTHGIVAE